MEIRENVPLAPLTTFGVGGPARFFVQATKEEDVRQAILYARLHNLRIFVMGGGSNLVVSDAGWPGLVLKIALKGVEDTGDAVPGKRIFSAAAGEDWDAFVAHCVAQECAGIETLSGIPGTIGGTPVQNVGAYGQEVSSVITNVRVLDVKSLEVRELTNKECAFGYRRSMFNSFERDHYIVLRVAYTLTPGGKPLLAYADLQRYFAGAAAPPTLAEAREAVRAIRHSKAMLIVDGDPNCRSAGSFFKNPIVEGERYAAIAAEFDAQVQPPNYPAQDGKVKMSAAWLVERAGFPKGFGEGKAGLSSKHTLAIVNRGGASARDILDVRDTVLRGVRERFGIELQQEPVLVGF